MDHEPLTPENLPEAVRLWPDRVGYTDAEFDVAIRNAATLLGQGRALGALIRDGGRTWAFGMTVYVHEAFAEQYLSAPYPQLGKALLLGACHPTSPILTPSEIARRNAHGGLQLVVVSSNLDLAVPDRPSTLGTLMRAFFDTHAGYRVACIFDEVFGEPIVEDIEMSAAFELRLTFSHLCGGVPLPGLVGFMTREEAVRRRSALLPMFAYSPPRIGFSASQQMLLRAALAGEPDEELAAKLGTSVSAVKARWTRIYQRAARQLPASFGRVRSAAGDRRGAQVRHHLVNYVRNNPSELTPYSAVDDVLDGGAP